MVTVTGIIALNFVNVNTALVTFCNVSEKLKLHFVKLYDMGKNVLI
jgi:hypothetical protein